jgi:hypothetical protein
MHQYVWNILQSAAMWNPDPEYIPKPEKRTVPQSAIPNLKLCMLERPKREGRQ